MRKQFLIFVLFAFCASTLAQTTSSKHEQQYFLGGEVSFGPSVAADLYLKYGISFEQRFAKHWGYELGLGCTDFYYARSETPYFHVLYLNVGGNMIFYSNIVNVRLGTASQFRLTANLPGNSKTFLGPIVDAIMPSAYFMKISHDFQLSQRFYMEPYVGISTRIEFIDDITFDFGLRLKVDLSATNK